MAIQRTDIEDAVGGYGEDHFLPVASLRIDQSYQRPLSERRARMFAAEWDSVAAGRLVANVRDDGAIYVVDGQHRLAAMRLCGITSAPCVVYYGWLIEEEARVFRKLNITQRKPNKYHEHRAGVRGGELVPTDIEKIVGEFGFATSDRSNTNHGSPHRSQDYIAAIAALYTIYQGRYGGPDRLRQVLRILTSAYPGRVQPHMVDGEVLTGLYSFLIRVRKDGNFRESHLITRLSRTPVVSLLNQSRALIGGGESPMEAMTRVLWNLYNLQLRDRRLQPFGGEATEE